MRSHRIDQQIIRGGINLAKAALLKQLNLFSTLLDAYYRNTDFHDARPHAPSIGDGQEKFTDPLLDAATLWERMNEGPAPACVTLPLVLGDGTTQENFSDAVDALIADYRAEKRAAQETTLSYTQARADSLLGRFLDDGVDTDSEMQKLLEIEQAYAANAKVISTVDQLLQQLMAI